MTYDEPQEVRREPQIQHLTVQLLDRTNTLESELGNLSSRLIDIKHANEPELAKVGVSDIGDRVPLAEDMFIVLARIDACIEVIRTLAEALEI